MIILILFSFFSNLYSAGFVGNTLLLTNSGQIRFDEVGYETFIKSHENTLQPVLFLAKQSVAKVVQINIANEQIVCHKKQLFWCVNKNDWLYAKHLHVGDLLQTINDQYILIDAVEIVEQQTEIYSLSVGPPHHLYVGKHVILAHNVAWFVGVGIELAFGSGAIEFIKGSIVVAIGALVIQIQNHFAKNKDKKKPNFTVSVQPVCNSSFFDPNDDENNKDKYPHGVYKGVDYHGQYQNGSKSPAPQNGQKALNNSYEFNKKSGGRVAIENDEFVILRRTNPREFHGYRCDWQKVPSKAKAILQKLKLVSQRGDIF